MVPKLTDQVAVRSQVVTVRLDPKLKYLAELAARKQRRTLSSYIEWAVEQSLRLVPLKEIGTGDDRYEETVSLAEVNHNLWDVDESDRLANLAFAYSDLLTHREQVLWKIIRETGYFWLGKPGPQKSTWLFDVRPENLRRDELKRHWRTLNDVADGKKSITALPPRRDSLAPLQSEEEKEAH